MSVIDKIHMLKKMVKEADRIVAWQETIYTALHNIDASWVVSGTIAWAQLAASFPRTIAQLLSDHNLANHVLGVIVPHDALASLTEKAHTSLTNVTANQHHTKYTDAEAQAQAAALIAIHAAIAAAHHARYADAEADARIALHAAIAAAHHAKTTDAAEIVSGTFPVVRGGTGLNTIALGGILYASALDVLSRLAPTAGNQVLRSTAVNALQFAALLAADIPNLDASKITSGRFPMTRMPDMGLDKIMVGQGAGNSPVEEDKGSIGIPSGLITMWHGTIVTIPAGWVICDGNNSTPNLLARFVEGVATATTDPGATGGATSKAIPSHKLTVSEMPAHSHDLSTLYRRGTYSGESYESGTRHSTAKHTTVSVGGSGFHGHGSISDIRPKFYDIAFIMKT